MANPGLVIELTNISAFESSMKNLDKVLNSIDDRLENAAQVIDRIGTRGRGATKAFSGIAAALKELRGAVFSPAQAAGVVNFSDALARLQPALQNLSRRNVTALRDLISILNDAGRLPATNLAFSAQNVEQLKTLVDVLAGIGKAGISSLQQSVAAVRVLTKIIEELRKTAQVDVGFFSRLFGGGGLTKSLKGFGPFIKVLGEALISLRQIASGAAENAVKAASGAIRAIVQIIKLLNDPALGKSDIVIGARGLVDTRLSKFLRGIRPFTKILAEALGAFKNIPPPKNLTAVATTLRALFRIISELQKIDSSPETKITLRGAVSTRLSKFLTGIRNFTSILADAINRFRSVRVDPGLLKPIAQFIEAMAEVIRLAQEDVDPARLASFAQAMNQISEAISKGFSAGAAPKGAESAGLNTGMSFLSGVSKALAITSPSRAMIVIGQKTIQGFVLGIRGSLGLVRGLATTISSALIGGFARNAQRGVALASRFFRELPRNVGRALRTTLNLITSTGRRLATLGAQLAQGFARGFQRVLSVVFRDALRDPLRQVQQFGRDVSREIDRIGRTVQQTGRNLLRSGIFGVAAGGVVGFLQGQMVGLASNFDQVLNQIKVFGRITGQELANVERSLLKFSAATIFAPQQAADAFLGLQKAGLSVVDSLKALPIIGNLAAAATLDLANATDITVKAMTAFGLGVDSATRIADAFVGAADISTAEVSDLGDALGFVGPVARQLQIPIEDVATALAFLNDQGIDASMSGRSMRAVLSSLAAPSAEAKTALRSLGIQIQDSEGNFVGLSDLIGQFGTAVERLRAQGLGEVEILDRLSALGDRQAVSALLALLNSTGEEMITLADGSQVAAKSFDGYRARLDGALTASEAAEAQMDTFRGRVIALKGSVDTLIITALKPLLNDTFKPIVEVLIELVNNIAALDPKILSTAAAIGIAATAALTLVSVFSILAGLLLIGLGPQIRVIGVLLGAVFNPLGAIRNVLVFGAALTAIVPLLLAVAGGVAAIGLIAASVLSDIRNNVGGAGDALQRFKSGISESFGVFIEFGREVSRFVGTFGAFASEAFGFASAASGSFSIVAIVLDTINNAIIGVANAFSEVTAGLRFFTDTAQFLAGTLGPTEETSERIRQVEEETNALLEERERLVRLINGEIEEGAEIQEGIGDRLVVSGDTLSAIAREFGISLDELIAANPEISDPNLIFAGQTIKIPGAELSDEARQNLIDEVARIDKEIGAKDAFKINLGQLTEAEELTRFQESIDRFAQTDLFKKLFGEDSGARARAVQAVGEIESIFRRIGIHVAGIGVGIRRLFGRRQQTEGLKLAGGLDTIRISIGRLAQSFIDLFELLTGADVSDELENSLLAGDFAGIIRRALSRLGRTILDQADNIATIAATAVEFLVRQAFFGFPRFLLDLFGIDLFDPVFSRVDEIANTIGTVIGSAVSNLFSVISGEKTPAEAISGFLSDIDQAIKDSPFLSSIAEKLDFVDAQPLLDSFDEIKEKVVEVLGSEEFKTASAAFLNLLSSIGRFTLGLGFILLGVTLEIISAALDNARPTLELITPVLNDFADAFDAAIKALQDLSEEDTETIENVLIGLGLALVLIAPGLLITLGGAMAAFAAGFLILKIGLEGAEFIIDILGGIGRTFKGIISGDPKEIGAGLKEIADGALDLGGVALDNLAEAGQLVLGIFGIKEEDVNVKQRLDDLGDNIRALQPIVELAGLTMQLAFQNLNLKIQEAANTLASFFIDVVGKIPGALDKLGIEGDFQLFDVEDNRRAVAETLDDLARVRVGIGRVGDELIAGTLDPETVRSRFEGLGAGVQAELLAEIDKAIQGTQDEGLRVELTNLRVDVEREFDLETTLEELLFPADTQVDVPAGFGVLQPPSDEELARVAQNLRNIIFDPAVAEEAEAALSNINFLESLIGEQDLSPEQQARLTEDIGSFIESALEGGLAPEQILGLLERSGVSRNIVEALVSSFESVPEGGVTFEDLGLTVVDGMVVGIKDSADKLKDTVRQDLVQDGIITPLQEELESESPSQVSFREGENLIEGFRLGMLAGLPTLSDAFSVLNDLVLRLQIQTQRTAGVVIVSLSQASVSMTVNAGIMEDAATRMVIALNNIGFAAGEAAVAVGQLASATAGGIGDIGGIGGDATPEFQQGGFTGEGGGSFLARLHRGEFVVPSEGALVLHDSALISTLNETLRPLLSAAQAGFIGGQSPIIAGASTDARRFGDTIQIFIDGDEVSDARIESAVRRGMNEAQRRNPITLRGQKRGAF
jgi:TP901 family phage tail tape measure protein